MLAVKPPVIPRIHRQRTVVKPKAITLQQSVEITGQYLGLFVLFTSTMNWWHYRKIRKDQEKKM
jgi:hypothetical protein